MKCHQRIIRERKSQEGDGGLFGNWWDKLNTDIGRAELRETTLRTAASVIEEYEYLGTMPNAPMKAYGIFWDGNCGGVVVFGAVSPPSVAESVTSAIPEKVIQLARGACVHWAHPHSASKLIAFGLREIEKLGWRIVIAYSDPDAGEIGTVYQATNWMYCGLTAKRPDYLRPDGTRWVGHMKAGVASTLETKDRTRKGRYVYILGSHRERKFIRKTLLWSQKPYPKRAVEVSKVKRDGSTVEGEVQFLDAAPIL